MSMPSIPPRPARSQNHGNMDIPRIPPRPNRQKDRSVSPNHDRFALSPFNDHIHQHGPSHPPNSNLAVEPPRRPSSVALPSIGDEGNEYANLDNYDKAEKPTQADDSPTQTKNVSEHLPMHAPKASLPVSSAKARIATVTRTDSDFAAQAGIGKTRRESEGASGLQQPSRTSSSSGTRPQSLYKEEPEREQGIPGIGLQVPLLAMAGDVQAPSPSPFQQAPSSGIGFHNNVGSASAQGLRHHSRTKSGREVFTCPPGSYGLHGHGSAPKDSFERAWYEKHPSEAAREEQGHYGPAVPMDRKEW
ncbi:hypothetical protein LTS18_014566, partial [Coniosporium uncinatum]